MGRWVIDGNNVMGSRPDGWWNDRPAAMARLAQQVATWCWTHDDPVVLVFDGPDQPDVSRLAGGNLTIRFSGSRPRRDAADGVIVAIARSGDTVVTADRGLRARLGSGVATTGPRTLLDLLSR